MVDITISTIFELERLKLTVLPSNAVFSYNTKNHLLLFVPKEERATFTYYVLREGSINALSSI